MNTWKLLAFALLLTGQVLAQGPGYVVRDLGSLGGNSSMAYGLNASGTAGGISTLSNGDQHAFSWTAAGGMVDLGVAPGHVMSCTRTIGASGEAVGWNQSSVLNPTSEEAFLWLPSPAFGQPAGMTLLGTLGGNSSRVGQHSLNSSGAVVGWSTTASGQTHGFVWLPTPLYGLPAGINDLGVLNGPFSSSRAINNQGQIVGASTLGFGQVATIWTAAQGLVSLGSLGGQFAEAIDITQSGSTCGWSQIPFSTTIHGWVRSGTGPMVDIGTLPQFPNLSESLAYGINASEEVVGWVSPGPCCPIQNVARAVIWNAVDGLRDLNDLIAPGSAFVLESAWNINDAGQIAGGARMPNGDLHAVVLTPAALELSVDQNPAAPNTTLVVSATGGPPGADFLFGILKVNGVYSPLLLDSATLDLQGNYSLSVAVPPGLAGTTFTLISASSDVFGNGSIVSNTVLLSFL